MNTDSKFKLLFSGSRRLAAFTLTELLVVIGIMAIITAVTIPSFQGIGRGTAMTTAIMELKTTLSLSRQWAITHRQKVYVVFPDRMINYSGIQSHLYKACKAYGVFALTNVASGDVKEGYYVKEWTFLPQGVVFDDDDDRSQTVFTNRIENVPFTDGANLRDLYGIIFKPDGTTERYNGYEIFLRDGWAVVDTNSWVPSYGVNSNGANRGVEVSGLTGGLKLHDYQSGY